MRMKHYLHLPDMCCAVEGNEAKAVLDRLAGVTDVSFNTLNRSIAVTGEVSSEELLAALRSAGIPASPLGGPAAPSRAPALPWARLGLALALALASEILEYAAAPQSLVVGASLAAVALAGVGTFASGLRSLVALRLNMNVLMSVAVAGSAAIGHFPEAAMVMALFAISEAIEALSVRRANGAIEKLLKRPARPVPVLNDAGGFTPMPVEAVTEGAVVRILEGEYVALDGTVLEGAAEMDESAITGEPLPKTIGPGEALLAGTVCVSGEVTMQVGADASHSTVSKIVATLEEAAANKSGLERFVDRFATVYTPCVFALAVAAWLAFWLVLEAGFTESVYRALVLLVIACPCALVISTPVTVVAALTVAARNGLIVKGGAFIERVRVLRHLAFDKTGTVTEGRPVLREVFAPGYVRATRALAVAAGLASHSRHPLSEAIVRRARAEGLEPVEPEAFRIVTGSGFEATMRGQELFLQNASAFLKRHPGYGGTLLEKALSTTSLVLFDALGPIAVFTFEDAVRPEAKSCIEELQGLGIDCAMLTGDNEANARGVAQAVGIRSWRANLLPADKLECVRELKASGPTGMVGDGTNDSPALAGADVSFTPGHTATAVALEASDIVMVDPNLKRIGFLVRLSRRMHARILENVVFALAVKALFAVLAFLGLASMWMAVFADIGVTLIVVAWGLALLKTRAFQ